MTATVLVVDDEETAHLRSQTLRDAGYEALEAGNLAQAHAALDAGAADIVLLDVFLPDGSGLTLLERIARENPSPPVILITAFGEVETHAQARDLGAALLLDKPFDINDLRRAVRGAVRH
jgi:two-component system response regulator (stage 0 sporulation protein F)